MIYLLDTHVLIWAISDPSKLSKKVKELLENTKNKILVSSLSLWEISLKFSLKKLDLGGMAPQDFPDHILKIGFDVIPISAAETSTFHFLKSDFHRDPFDRMLIWQAIKQDVVLISKDERVAKYKESGLKVVW